MHDETSDAMHAALGRHRGMHFGQLLPIHSFDSMPKCVHQIFSGPPLLLELEVLERVAKVRHGRWPFQKMPQRNRHKPVR